MHGETCDRCCAPALTRWRKIAADGHRCTLALCGHHTREAEPGLRERSWLLSADERPLLLPALP